MSKKEYCLNRHEQLRYEYLLAHLSYLNDHERAEYRYLYQKKQALEQSPRAFQERTSPSEPFDSVDRSPYLRKKTRQDDLVTEQGLPLYPDMQSPRPPKARRKSRRRRRQKRKKSFAKRFGRFIFTLVFLMGLILLALFFKGRQSFLSTSQSSQKPALEQSFNGQKASTGTNILILGSDKRITQESGEARADTIMVLHLGSSDHQPRLVSFMRDTLVHIPGSDSFVDQKLNAAFSYGSDASQGAEMVRQTLKENFDLAISYYLMIDFETFAEAVDTLFPEGVEIDAQFASVDGELVDSVPVPDDLNRDESGQVPTQIIATGRQMMDGRTLLNYARFRKDDQGDYGRTQRQQQVLSAIIQQIKDPRKLFTGSEALGKIHALTATNIPYSYLLKEGLATALNGQLQFKRATVPELGDWEDTYDRYGGQGLAIDFEAYKAKLADLGLRSDTP